MKYWFPVSLLLLFGILLAFIFGPLFEDPSDIKKTSLRGACALTVFPLGLFYAMHPTSLLSKWNKRLVDSLFAAGGVCALLTILLIAKAMFGMAFFSIVASILFLYLARTIWLKVKPPAKTNEGLERVKSSPAGDVYNRELRLLDQESDPGERKKLAASLQRFKDGWRLK